MYLYAAIITKIIEIMSDQSMIKIHPSWYNVLKEEFDKEYFIGIKNYLIEERNKGNVFYPKGSELFNAYDLTSFESIKVVILGQDPYHGVGQAHGLCFSVPEGVKPPPSLVNIYKEINSDLNIPIPTSGNLIPWAKQGVFLLNCILTVRAQMAASHANIGWQNFTDATIRAISNNRTGIVFLLWGAYAIKKSVLIDSSKHFILQSPHPSPLSAYQGFFGNKHFSKTNDILLKQNRTPIDWSI